MSHHDDIPDERLYGALREALEPEPPMCSQPSDDLRRGRRRLRRRRIGAAAGVAAVLPVAAIVGWTVPSGSSAGPSSPGFSGASDGPSNGHLSGRCVTGRATAPPRHQGGIRAAKGRATAIAGSACRAVPGKPIGIRPADRLTSVLSNVLDRGGGHLSSSGLAAAANGNAGDLGYLSVAADWHDGVRVGAVDLSVLDPAAGTAAESIDATAPCQDPGLAGGPRLTCTTRRLSDGSAVQVGTGSRAGLVRITVRFDRPDGQLVWATADQASHAWWGFGNGAKPLAAPPASVAGLVALATDARAYL